jgi:hypothetical protein
MVTDIDELNKRVNIIEKQKKQEVLTLVEILSNATFFGEIRKSNCEHAKNGQCSFYLLEKEVKNKIPIVAECRIRDCEEPSLHYHIEISNISCTLCQKIKNGSEKRSSQNGLKKTKSIPQNSSKKPKSNLQNNEKNQLLKKKNKIRGKEK